MSAWKTKIIPYNKWSRPTTKLRGVRKIVMHYTANNGAGADNHYRYFKNLNGRYASAHFMIDKIEAIQIIPLNEVAYHANDIQRRNANGSAYRGVSALLPNANLLSIGLEMCLESNGTIHPETVRRSEDVAVELCRRYKLDPLKDIVRHYDVTGKQCPLPWVRNSQEFNSFKVRVNNKMKGVSVPVTPPSTSPSQPVSPTSPSTKHIGTVKITYTGRDGINIRSGATFTSPITRQLYSPNSYKVYRIENGMLNVGGNDWITANEKYVKYTPISKPSTSARVYMKLGDKGEDVKNLQRNLNKVGYNLAVDGSYGNATRNAVLGFQKTNGLVQDGFAGTATQSTLRSVVSRLQSASKKKYLVLPKTADSWRVYPTNKSPVKANALSTKLNPKKFGGLTYEILGNPQANVYIIQTSQLGRVQIYAGRETGATVIEK